MQISRITFGNRNIIVIMGLCLLIGVSCVPPTDAPQPSIPQPTISPTAVSQPTLTATQNIPTSTVQPTQTAMPATDEPVTKLLEIIVPPGSQATIDGIISPGEWEPAVQFDLADEGQILLMYSSGYLYLGVRAKPEPVTSICVDQGEQVSILHSSAAIGTAVYQQSDGEWKQIRDFEWCCRQATDSPQAQEAINKHLQEEGWVANNGLRGVPEEIEFQIAMPGNSLRLAVNAIGPPSYRSVISWPESLQDDCSRLSMITGPIPEEAQFSLQEWVTLSISQD